MPCTLSPREQLAKTIRESEIEDLIESESNSDREEDILLLHDIYTKCYLVPRSSNKLSKTYPPEDLMQLSPYNFKQLTWTTHIAFGKLCDLLRGDSIFYNNSRHKQIALEIQVAVNGQGRLAVTAGRSVGMAGRRGRQAGKAGRQSRQVGMAGSQSRQAGGQVGWQADWQAGQVGRWAGSHGRQAGRQGRLVGVGRQSRQVGRQSRQVGRQAGQWAGSHSRSAGRQAGQFGRWAGRQLKFGESGK
ncbi:hypothetical protein PPACK8108_LOCUS24922 [Phakopsora pachyrhizi]|uniref:Uncharacterized protein n=1 Tax=Phakopsora pachyrhizi TaxID=170000 RepID=A0AAV0BQY2_PHAPC|nr:hypothetical protein PPACK8108_LOCUS24922 [Phakopsora pachyrhizi]